MGVERLVVSSQRCERRLQDGKKGRLFTEPPGGSQLAHATGQKWKQALAVPMVGGPVG